MKLQTLPTPSNAAQKHSDQLRQTIIDRIKKQGGRLSFHDYMQACLYEPGLGYYNAGSTKFGEAGDFITAPELSPFFATSLARQCEQILESLPKKNILEFGAGSGKLAADILQQLTTSVDHYYILEVSPDLKARQAKYLKQHLNHLYDRIVWLNTLPKNFTGVILANEVVDAMPVHRIQYNQGELQEFYVCDNGGLKWQLGELSAQMRPLKNTLISKLPHDHGYVTEINRMQSGWMKSIAECLTQGVAFIIDYGFTETGYFHPDRHMGTLMCHYRHYAHDDVFFYPGLQDITAHVNFSALAESGINNGLTLEGFTNQASFLVNTALNNKNPPKNTKTIHRLLHPGEMGELFKVIGFSQNFTPELIGFADFDLCERL